MHENKRPFPADQGLLAKKRANLSVGKHGSNGNSVEGEPKGAVSLLEPDVRSQGLSAVIVLESFDVVFSEVGALLNLDEHEKRVADILNPVSRNDGDIDGLSG
jgi:hypothetical protein